MGVDSSHSKNDGPKYAQNGRCTTVVSCMHMRRRKGLTKLNPKTARQAMACTTKPVDALNIESTVSHTKLSWNKAEMVSR